MSGTEQETAAMPDRERSGDERPGREDRPYPHGTGDRNAWSPTRKDPMPLHGGGTQRKTPPEPDAGHGD